mmetsp:Transcript_11353/g.20120  ORF Transcript_11353/g.20120 Transcript_11353/m.20120 type:complete len:103 (+) Transcript_11353:34-342(+)
MSLAALRHGRLLARHLAPKPNTITVVEVTQAVLPRVSKDRGFASLVPGDKEKFTMKKFMKGPIPPIGILLLGCVYMNLDWRWDDTPKMHSRTQKVFGNNGPF